MDGPFTPCLSAPSAPPHSARALEAALQGTGADCLSFRARSQIALLNPGLRARQDRLAATAREAGRLRCTGQTFDRLFISATEKYRPDVAASRLVHLPEATGEEISSCLHYLGSPRLDGEHFGLVDPVSNLLIAYASINPLDWELILDAVRPIGNGQAEYSCLSRVCVPRIAPRNSISRMLSLICRSFDAAGRRALITTAVDQNLGFSGTSYLSSGWRNLFSVPHLGYIYLDDSFITRRELLRQFGTDNLKELQQRLGARIQTSGPLPDDTLIFATGTTRDLRQHISRAPYRRLERAIGPAAE